MNTTIFTSQSQLTMREVITNLRQGKQLYWECKYNNVYLINPKTSGKKEFSIGTLKRKDNDFFELKIMLENNRVTTDIRASQVITIAHLYVDPTEPIQ